MSDMLHPVDGYFTDVFAAKIEPPAWVIKDLLPVGLTIVGGPPKLSKKSTLTLAMAALVAGYRCAVLPEELSQVEMKGPVMMFSFEAMAGELRHTLETEMLVQGEPDAGILVADIPEEFLLDSDEGYKQIMFWLEERKPRVLIIDPLRNAHTLDEKDSGELVRILVPIRRWAKQNNCAVIVVHHTRKLEDDREYTPDDLRGSSSLFGLCDGVIMITPTRVPMQFGYYAIYKRGGEWRKTIQLSAYETKGQRAGEALRNIDKQLLKSIEGGADTIRDIALDTSTNANTVRERLTWLADRRYVAFKGGKWSVLKGDTK